MALTQATFLNHSQRIKNAQTPYVFLDLILKANYL